MKKLIILLTIFNFIASITWANEEVIMVEQSGLATELEQIKSQIQQLNRELFILEEDLLFPASTQIAVFISVDIGKFYSIDSVELKIDSQDVAGFLYTSRQRKALEQGGIQQLFQGNLKEGSHKLVAIFTGINNDGRTVKKAIEHDFEKSDESLMIEIKVIDKTENYRAEVFVEEWVL